MNPSTIFLFTDSDLVISKALPLSFMNNGEITLIKAKKVFIQKDKIRDSLPLSPVFNNIIKGVTIVPICQVIVFIATACPKTFLGTTLAVNADLAGPPKTLLAASIPETR